MNKDQRFQYCGDNPEPYLEGSRDSSVAKEEHAYIIYEIHKCSDEIWASIN